MVAVSATSQERPGTECQSPGDAERPPATAVPISPASGFSPGVDPGLITDAIDAMGDAFVIYDENDRLVLCNSRYREFFPLVSDLLVPGAAFADIARASVLRGQLGHEVTPLDDYVRWRTKLEAGSEKSHVVQLNDGRWIRKSDCRTADGRIVGIRTDVTELKQREAALVALTREVQSKNVQFDTALNNMSQGLCFFDAAQRLVVCNQRYLEMYGFSPEKVRPGIELSEILQYSVFLGNHTSQQIERIRSERPIEPDADTDSSYHEHLQDGRVISVAYRPMPDGGWVATYDDVSRRVQAEDALREYAAKLERSNRELQDFAFIASHDMQEPLRKIEAFGDRLQARFGHILNEDGRLYLDRMQSAAKRMRSLINAVLAYSRVSTKTCPFERVSLPAVLHGVLSDLQLTTDETNATIEVGPLPEIDADPIQMRQLFQNLIGNALKFRRPDTAPLLNVTARLVSAIAADGPARSADGALCEIAISDNGIGFEEKYLDRIFNIFQRLHGRNEYEGTGIGLAAVRKIVERHGGSITARSTPGEGSTFLVTLPSRHPRSDASR